MDPAPPTLVIRVERQRARELTALAERVLPPGANLTAFARELEAGLAEAERLVEAADSSRRIRTGTRALNALASRLAHLRAWSDVPLKPRRRARP